MEKTPLVILNSNAGSKKHDRLREAATERGYRLMETEHTGHGTEIAREAALQGVPLIIAAGGDGTVCEVATGILESEKPAVLGIIPLGTGNDLCRSLDIESDVEAALSIIKSCRMVEIDVGRLKLKNNELLFFNVSSCGFSGLVDKHLEETDKSGWGTLSYLKSGIAALTELEPFRVDVHCEGETISVDALNVVVGNGRYAASGIPVAPQASLTDGKLDVVLYMGKGLSDQIFNSRLILTGEQDRSDTILSLRSEKFAMTFSNPLSLNYDGELHHHEVDEVTYTIHPRHLRVIVGGNFT